MHITLDHIRKRAVAASLFPPTTLGRAVARLGFVQADPIRSPARAQDLILRHRVTEYRAGDLERRFKALRLEEDFLYAYGFMPRDTQRLLHPRRDLKSRDGRHEPTGLAAEVLAFVRGRKTTHPRDLMARFGAESARNGWGGLSKATTYALQSLHYHGLLRVARRRDGIRVYEPAPAYADALEPQERLRRLVLLVARNLAPISDTSLRATLRLLARGAPGLGGMSDMLKRLVASGELAGAEVDGERYLWPVAGEPPEAGGRHRRVRFLAPFDPIVWDRRRFEHLWGWDYRFEAYTPAAKRRFGYYAMPLLFDERVIGWVNVAADARGPRVEPGFARRRPAGSAFVAAFDAEVARLRRFLPPRDEA